MGAGFTLASKTDGTLWAWGAAGSGQLGQNARTLRSSPVQIPGTTWDYVNVSNNSAYAIKTDGTLWAWGQGSDGKLSQNNTAQYSSPVQVGDEVSWLRVKVGKDSVLASLNDSTP